MTIHPIATARACANIALAKYWGKCDVALNLPAVPSLSLTLDGLVTTTRVQFDDSIEADGLTINGAQARPNEWQRVHEMLNQVRERSGLTSFASVVTSNRFPTAAGLASSASGFAALAAAACAAANLNATPHELSALARQSSASAARSIFGGFVELHAGTPGNGYLHADQLAPEDHWDVRIVVVQTASGEKSVGSTAAMTRSAETSPFYDSWVNEAPRIFNDVRRGVLERNLALVGPAMELSTFMFHSTALSSVPPIVYWSPVTMAVIKEVFDLRATGVSAWLTMDAGPHVKVLCAEADSPLVATKLRRIEGVIGTQTCRPGPGFSVKTQQAHTSLRAQ